MNPDELQEIQNLFQSHMSIRSIARRLGRDPKTIRRALGRPRRPPAATSARKLEPFQELIAQMASQDLTAPRILRELRARSYSGGLTILKQHLRQLRGTSKPPRPVFRRFETRPAEEGQVDWSPYRLRIGNEQMVVHCFSMILGYSRRLWIGFYRNERLPTLLHAHVQALEYHQGCPLRIVYDNQTTVTLGRVAKAPLWHPSFLEFARFYGFQPYAARVGHKERKGKVERPFSWIEADLLRGSVFDSLEHLRHKTQEWLDTVANVRRHSTTARRVDEMYAEEKPLLIALPPSAFPTARTEQRKVQKDGYVPIDGSFYPAPAHLVGHDVPVRIYPDRVEILDAGGQVAAAFPIPDRPKRLSLPWPAPAQAVTPGRASLTVLETRFLACFPMAEAFLVGLKRRMNALAPIHLHQIQRLLDLYGDSAVAAAIEHATNFHNFSAQALTRILQRQHPNVVPEPPAHYTNASPEILGAIDDVEPSSPRQYTLDQMPPTEEKPHATQE
jgi:transposase